MTGPLYSPVDGALIPDTDHTSDADMIDRLVIDLARATGTPEALIRLGVGLPPIGAKPRYPTIPAPDPEAIPL